MFATNQASSLINSLFSCVCLFVLSFLAVGELVTTAVDMTTSRLSCGGILAPVHLSLDVKPVHKADLRWDFLCILWFPVCVRDRQTGERDE